MIDWIYDQKKLPAVGTEVLLACQWQRTDRLVVVLARQVQFDPNRPRGWKGMRRRGGDGVYIGWQSTWDGVELDADLHPVAFAMLTAPNLRDRR